MCIFSLFKEFITCIRERLIEGTLDELNRAHLFLWRKKLYCHITLTDSEHATCGLFIVLFKKASEGQVYCLMNWQIPCTPEGVDRNSIAHYLGKRLRNIVLIKKAISVIKEGIVLEELEYLKALALSIHTPH